MSKRILVPKPSGGPALLGISNHHPFVTMGNDLAIVSPDFKRTNTMKEPSTGRPQLDLLDESKKGDLLSIIDFLGGFLCHSYYHGAD